MNDLDAVAYMIKHAGHNGLLLEVILTFGVLRSHGEDVHHAVLGALNDWDI